MANSDISGSQFDGNAFLTEQETQTGILTGQATGTLEGFTQTG